MELTPPLFNFLRLIYRLPEKNLARDRPNCPLQVLTIGISRSGTESLRQALIRLRYADCHHGFRYITEPAEVLQWVRLALAQRRGDKSNLSAEKFDKCLGDCQALTDQPSCGIALELLDAYPEAKEILNYREDVDAWHRSFENTIEKHNRLAT